MLNNHVNRDAGKHKVRTQSMVAMGEVQKIDWGLNIPWEDVSKDRMLGQGSFGEVWMGHYKGKRIAVKRVFLPEDADEKEETLEDFHKEMEILQMLNHPNIVHFFGAVQEDPHYAVLTELCEGSVVDLLMMVKKRRIDVTWKIVIDIATECAAAMFYLHNLNPQILHRDLKAENLLITEDFICKLTDFGLSRILNDPGACERRRHKKECPPLCSILLFIFAVVVVAHRRLVGRNCSLSPGAEKHMTLCGTPSWIAPEIFRGDAYSSAVDVYSFAIVFWELINFKKPYGDQDRVKLPYLIGVKRLRPTIPQHLPPYLTDLMTDCWKEDPHERPTFKEVVSRLKLSGERGVAMEGVVDPKVEYRAPEPIEQTTTTT